MQREIAASLVILIVVLAAGCKGQAVNDGVGNRFIVTERHPFDWEEDPISPRMLLRKEGDKRTGVCLWGDFASFEPGDIVILEYIDEDRCLEEGEYTVEIVPEPWSTKTMVCTWVGNVSMLEYAGFFGADASSIRGTAIYVESIDNQDHVTDTWWMLETSLDDFLNPPIVGTEIVDGSRLDVYEYTFEIPDTLTPYVICGQKLCPHMLLTTDFWYNEYNAFYIGQEDCVLVD